MALTVANLQLNLAYRLGESAAPSGTTAAQRLEWVNMAYFDFARRHNWFFLQGSGAANTNTGSTTGYAEPTDLKEFIELKISNIFYDQIPYTDNRDYTNTVGVVTLPTLRRSFKFYRFAGNYYLIPTDGNNAAVHYIKYYKRITKRTADADTFLIPDEYLEALTCYAEARYWMSIAQQAKASVPLQEYEAIIRQCETEHQSKGWGSLGFGMREPEDAQIRQ